MFVLCLFLQKALFKDPAWPHGPFIPKMSYYGHAAVGRPLGTFEIVGEMGSSDTCTDR